MARFSLAAPFEGVSGKLDKDDSIVFSQRYGNTHGWEHEATKKEPTANQLALRARFASAASKAAADMADPDKKAEWLAVAEASHGRWKTPRGAAFASYYSDDNGAD